MSDKVREEFERFAKTSDYADIRRSPENSVMKGEYLMPEVQRHWLYWQASRATLVVEFPPAPIEPEEPEFAIDDSHMDAYHAAVRMRDSCAKAIEAQGLKVKP